MMSFVQLLIQYCCCFVCQFLTEVRRTGRFAPKGNRSLLAAMKNSIPYCCFVLLTHSTILSTQCVSTCSFISLDWMFLKLWETACFSNHTEVSFAASLRQISCLILWTIPLYSRTTFPRARLLPAVIIHVYKNYFRSDLTCRSYFHPAVEQYNSVSRSKVPIILCIMLYDLCTIIQWWKKKVE